MRSLPSDWLMGWVTGKVVWEVSGQRTGNEGGVHWEEVAGSVSPVMEDMGH